MRRVRATLLAAFLLLAAWRGQAQSLRISVVDGASRRPLPSAVLTFLDASGGYAQPQPVVSLLEGIWRGDGWSAHLGDVTALMIVFGVCVAVSSKVFRWE